MNVTGVTVQDVSNKMVNTKFGPKPTYSFKADGEWYKTAFTQPRVKVGDVVDIEFTEGRYGKDVDAKTGIKVVGGGAAAPATAPRSAAPAPSYSGGKGVFPIPALDGQRSIVRQNALTNARELIQTAMALSKKSYEPDEIVASIIRVAKQFEAYTAGDMDMEAAKASVAKELEAAKAAT